jgi:hypothetical protein
MPGSKASGFKGQTGEAGASTIILAVDPGSVSQARRPTPAAHARKEDLLDEPVELADVPDG